MERPDDLVLARLVLARQRQLGVPWAIAWRRVLGVLPEIPGHGHPAKNRRGALAALERTASDWRAAYERLPASPAAVTVGAMAVAA